MFILTFNFYNEEGLELRDNYAVNRYEVVKDNGETTINLYKDINGKEKIIRHITERDYKSCSIKLNNQFLEWIDYK